MSSPLRRPGLFILGLALALLASSCVDSPAAPESASDAGALLVAPSLSLAGPGGIPAATAAQAGALQEAFARVDAFRVVATTTEGAQVLDTLVSVTPGQDSYDFQLPVRAAPGSTVRVVLIAFQGQTELFRSEPISVQARAAGTAGAPPPSPTAITLSYSGPGAEAGSLRLGAEHLVVGPGSRGTLTAQVLNQIGAPIAGVPLAWTTLSPATATVSAGEVTGVADGVTEVAVSTPTGLEARARVYVVGGELAFARGGALWTRETAAGSAVQRAPAGGAPAWSADGGRLLYAAGGAVFFTGIGSPIGSGAWPSLSPDGSKVAVERDGRVWYMNDNGRHPTQGPEGGAPVWESGSTLLVSGDGIQRIRADGVERATLAEDATGPAARASDGRIAYVAGGELHVLGAGALAGGVGGRPTWSADGRWLVVQGGTGLVVVPSDGSAPPVPLPGLEGASDPAFRPAGGLAQPPAVQVTAFEPSPPVPGKVARLLGSGFDWIIPANNRIVWPTREGPRPGEIAAVFPGAMDVEVPLDLTSGEVRVENRSTQAALAIQPPLTLQVAAATADARPVPGVTAVVTDASTTEVARGQTDAEGLFSAQGLAAGTYAVTLTAPTGFALQGDARRTVTLQAGLHRVEVTLRLQVATLRLVPERPPLEVGGSATVQVVALTAGGDTVRAPATVSWSAQGPTLRVAGDGLSGTLTGVAPSTVVGGSTLQVAVDGVSAEFPLTVTSYIQGLVTQEAEAAGSSSAPAAPGGAPPGAPQGAPEGTPQGTVRHPAPGITIVVGKDGQEVARERTIFDGTYKIQGLLAGSYTVSAGSTEKRSPLPAAIPVLLGPENPTGKADFLMTLAQVDSLYVAPVDTLTALEQQRTVSATALDSLGNALTRPLTYASSDTTVVTVSASGVVTARGNGTATLTVSAQGASATVPVTVDQRAVTLTLLERPAPSEIVAPDSARFFVSDTATAHWKAQDANGFPITPDHDAPTFSSSDPMVASVDGGGFLSALAVGIAQVTATLDGAADSLRVLVLGSQLGDYTVVDQSDLDAFAASLFGKVTGSLFIESTALTSLNGLQSLIEVGGNVFIRNNASLADISALALLESVGGNLVVENNDALVTPGGVSSALAWVGGSVLVRDNDALTHADLLGSLASVGWDVEIADNDLLGDLDGLGSLQEIEGSLYFRANPSLSSLVSFPALQTVHGSLVVEGGASKLGIPALFTVGGNLQVGGTSYDRTVLEELHLPALTTVGGEVYVYDNDNLTTLDLGALAEVGGSGPVDLSSRTRTARVGSLHAARALQEMEERYGSPEWTGAAGLAQLQEERAARGEEREARRSEREAVKEARARERRERERADLQARLDREAAAERGPYAVRGGSSGAASAAPADAAQILAADAAREARERPRRPERPARSSEYGYGGGFFLEWNPALASLDLGSLAWVSGDLNIGGALGLAGLDAPALEEVGGSLYLWDVDGPTSASFPVLHTLGEDLEIYDALTLTSFSAPSLRTVLDDLYVEYNAALTTFALPALEEVGYDLEIYDNDGLTTVDLPVLTMVHDDLEVDYNPDLVRVDMATSSSLTVGYDLEFYDNPALQVIHVPGLVRTEDDIYVAYNNALVSVVLGSSGDLTVGWDVEIYDNVVPHAWTLSIPGLVHVEDDVEIEYNEGLTEMTLASGNPASFGYWLEIYENPDLVSARFPSLAHLHEDLEVEYNDALQTLSFPTLQTVGDGIYFYDNGTAGVALAPEFPALTQVDYYIEAYENPGLTALSFPALTALAYDLWVTGNTTFTTLAAPLLEVMEGELVIERNPALTTLDFAALEEIHQGLYLSENDALASFSFPSLVAMGPALSAAAATVPGGVPIRSGAASIEMQSNPSLTSFSFPSLVDVGTVFVHDHAALVTLGSMPSLGAGATVTVDANPALTSLAGLDGVTALYALDIEENASLTDLPGLTSLTSILDLYIARNGALTTVDDFPALTTVYGSLFVSDEAALTTLSLPALTQIGNGGTGPSTDYGTLILDGNPVLSTVTLPVTSLTGEFLVDANGSLADLDFLGGVTTALGRLTVTNNALLADVDGLSGIGTATGAAPAVQLGVAITGNAVLDDCHVDGVLSTIAGRNGGSSGTAFPSGTTVSNVPCSQQE